MQIHQANFFDLKNNAKMTAFNSAGKLPMSILKKGVNCFNEEKNEPSLNEPSLSEPSLNEPSLSEQSLIEPSASDLSRIKATGFVPKLSSTLNNISQPNQTSTEQNSEGLFEHNFGSMIEDQYESKNYTNKEQQTYPTNGKNQEVQSYSTREFAQQTNPVPVRNVEQQTDPNIQQIATQTDPFNQNKPTQTEPNIFLEPTQSDEVQSDRLLDSIEESSSGDKKQNDHLLEKVTKKWVSSKKNSKDIFSPYKIPRKKPKIKFFSQLNKSQEINDIIKKKTKKNIHKKNILLILKKREQKSKF